MGGWARGWPGGKGGAAVVSACVCGGERGVAADGALQAGQLSAKGVGDDVGAQGQGGG